MIPMYAAPLHDPPAGTTQDDDPESGFPRPGAPRPAADEFERLLARLEAGYEFHTQQLARLMGRPDAESDTADAYDRQSLAAASRHALADIAAALRDMAEGRYGTCASCSQPIPAERLNARPEARHCLPCQARRHRMISR